MWLHRIELCYRGTNHENGEAWRLVKGHLLAEGSRRHQLTIELLIASDTKASWLLHRLTFHLHRLRRPKHISDPAW